MENSFDPAKIYEALVRSGDMWVDKDAAANLLEETKKTVLAELMSKSVESTVAAREQVALASPEYRLHVTQMVSARKEANRAKVNYDAQKVLAELRRTEQSNYRAEMGLK